MEREISSEDSKAAQRKELNIVKTKMGSCAIYELFMDTLEVLQSIQNCNWNEHVYHRGPSWNYQSDLEYGLIPGGKEKDQYRQAVRLAPTNLFRNDPKEEEPDDDLTENS